MTAPIVTVRGEAELRRARRTWPRSCTLHAAGDSAEADPRPAGQRIAGGRRADGAVHCGTGAVSTSGLHVSPTFNRRTPTKITGYTGTFSTTLVVADFEALSPLILGLSRLPEQPDRRAVVVAAPDNPVYREVRLAAITDARRRADDYAAAVRGRPLPSWSRSRIWTAASRRTPGRMAPRWDGAAGRRRFAFEPAEQTVSGQVTVRFTVRGVPASGRTGRVSAVTRSR